MGFSNGRLVYTKCSGHGGTIADASNFGSVMGNCYSLNVMMLICTRGQVVRREMELNVLHGGGIWFHGLIIGELGYKFHMCIYCSVHS